MFSFKNLMNLSAVTDFPSLLIDYISISFYYNHDFIDLLQNSLPLFTHNLINPLQLDPSKIF